MEKRFIEKSLIEKNLIEKNPIEKRNLSPIKEAVSLLGFGTMRYPMLGQEIDRETLRAMFDLAMSQGVNYYDTAYVYHGGQSEVMVGELLVDRYPRESFLLADKMPGWKLPQQATAQDMMDIFHEQQRRLHTEHIDFYLIHSLDLPAWEKLLTQGVLDFIQQLRESGQVSYIGFSFHDDPESLRPILAATKWDFAQIQLNYYDWQGEQNAAEQYRILSEAGLPIIVMEPIRGGALASLPEEGQACLEKAGMSSGAAAALRWVGSKEQVLTVLSGMSSLPQMEENCATFQSFRPINEEEEAAIQGAVAALNNRSFIPCTGCRYCCDECPQGIDVSKALKAKNEYLSFQNAAALNNYYRLLKPGERPQDCRCCGACARVCPQGIDVPTEMVKLAEELQRVLG